MTVITREQALDIVRKDAEEKNGFQAAQYRLEAYLESDGWHVAYISQDSGQRGGGAPVYVLDSKTGAILSKHYQR